MQRRQTRHMGLSNARLPLCSWEWEICLDLNLGLREFLAFWHFGEWLEGPQNDWRWMVLRIERMEWNVIEDWCKLVGHVFCSMTFTFRQMTYSFRQMRMRGWWSSWIFLLYCAVSTTAHFFKHLLLFPTGVAKSINAHVHPICSLSWTRNGRRLVSASTDNCVSVWDVLTGDCVHKFRFPSPVLKVVMLSVI